MSDQSVPSPLVEKNCLFPGSVGGGEAAAIAYALIETAEMNNVDPEAWLTWVLERIADHGLTPSTNSCRGTGSPKTPKTRPDRTDTIVTDIVGFLVGLAVQGVDVQDRDGAPDLLKSMANTYPLLHHVFADGGYAGPKLKGALEKIERWTLQIAKRSDTAQGFEVIPRRWGSSARSRGSNGAAVWP